MIAAVATVSIAAPIARAQAPSPDEPRTKIPYDDLSLMGSIYGYAQALNPFSEFIGVALPTPEWVLAKAACETGPNPYDRGRYAGMFGIMHRGFETDASGLPNNSTWGRWGGFAFARAPYEATPLEQIIVFLRIGYSGWHRPNGTWRPPSYSPKDNLCYRHADRVAGEQALTPLLDPQSYLVDVEAELSRYGLLSG